MSLLLTVVIPTLNRKAYLESTLRDLTFQDYNNFNIIVIDQSENKNEYEIPELLQSKVRIINQKEKSASKARNTGLLNANGDIVLFLDDDIIINNKSFIRNHCRHYVNTAISGVTGAILSAEGEFRSTRHRFSFNARYGWLFFPINYNKACSIGNGWAGNLSVRREYALEIGGMDEQYEKGAFREESDFCARLVKKYGLLQFDPVANIIHIGAPSGGLRAFGRETVIRGQHHFNGMFYFLFKNVRIIDYPWHFISFISIFYKRKNIIQNPRIIGQLIIRTVKGIFNGLVMLSKGPKIVTQV